MEINTYDDRVLFNRAQEVMRELESGDCVDDDGEGVTQEKVNGTTVRRWKLPEDARLEGR